MPLVAAKCTNCGGQLQVDSNDKTLICPFCHQPFVMETTINTYSSVTHNDIHDSVVHVHNQESADSLCAAGETLLQLEQYGAALNKFQTVTNLYPQDYRGWYGKVMASTQNLQASIEFQNIYAVVTWSVYQDFCNYTTLGEPQHAPDFNKNCKDIEQYLASFFEKKEKAYLDFLEKEIQLRNTYTKQAQQLQINIDHVNSAIASYEQAKTSLKHTEKMRKLTKFGVLFILCFIGLLIKRPTNLSDFLMVFVAILGGFFPIWALVLKNWTAEKITVVDGVLEQLTELRTTTEKRLVLVQKSFSVINEDKPTLEMMRETITTLSPTAQARKHNIDIVVATNVRLQEVEKALLAIEALKLNEYLESYQTRETQALNFVPEKKDY